MKEKLRQLMVGRYGSDALSNFSMAVGIGLVVISLFIKSQIIVWLLLALLVVMYFRMFSRNIEKRYAENQKFLEIKGKVTARFKGQKSRISQSKEYHIYKCPKCKQKIRIPRGKGKISITCPKCGEDFVKKS